MIPLIVALSSPLQPSIIPTTSPNWYGGRIYTSADVHVGIRPAVYVSHDEVAVGWTLQVTVRWP